MTKQRDPYKTILIEDLRLEFHVASTRKTPLINTDCCLLVHVDHDQKGSDDSVNVMVGEVLASVFCRYSRPFRMKPVESGNFLIKHLRQDDIDKKINATAQLVGIKIARKETGRADISYTEVEKYFATLRNI